MVTNMASSGKTKTTMAKRARESKLREKRAEKEARKQARKLAAAEDADRDSLATADYVSRFSELDNSLSMRRS
jgi:hypothetical protein